MSHFLPELVSKLCVGHDGWIVGSGADPENKNPRDFDVIVPFKNWNEAGFLIPSYAKRNTFGGWKCISEDREVDVWPGDLSCVMKAAKSIYLWHPYSGIRWKKC